MTQMNFSSDLCPIKDLAKASYLLQQCNVRRAYNACLLWGKKKKQSLKKEQPTLKASTPLHPRTGTFSVVASSPAWSLLHTKPVSFPAIKMVYEGRQEMFCKFSYSIETVREILLYQKREEMQ